MSAEERVAKKVMENHTHTPAAHGKSHMAFSMFPILDTNLCQARNSSE
mgnify:FL=1